MSPLLELWTAGSEASQALLAGGVVLLGYTVLGISGFGSALIIIPALLWQWPLTFVVPLVLLLDLPAALLHAWLNRRAADLAEWRQLLPWMLGGVALGSLLQGHADHPVGQALLGLGLCAAAWRGLRTRAPPPRAPDGAVPVAGLGMGAIEAIFGVCGPVVSTWLARRTRDPLALRATTALVLATATFLALAALGAHGRLLDARLWAYWVGLLVPAWAGVHIGQALVASMPLAWLRVSTWGLVLISGLGLLWRVI